VGRSWWGWGDDERHLGADALEGLAEGVAERFGIQPPGIQQPVGVEDLDLPAPRVAVPAALAEVVTDSPDERARHAHGQAYVDVVRAFHGELEAFPDLVALPRDEGEVEAVLGWCADEDAACIPFGGGTSVVGGVNPPSDRRVVSLDTRNLSGVAEVDRVSLAARVRAGTPGPALEDALRPLGLTMRFYPQSWEHSTLGGWVATRAGGHDATLRTHVDDLVEAVSAVTPAGRWESRRLPASGAGPSPDRLLLGSEGALGVITDAWVRIRRRPTFRADATVNFADFATGCAAVRDLVQAGSHPANCRLLDPAEALLNGAGDGSDAVLVLGYESADHALGSEIERALEICWAHGGESPEGPRLREGDRSGERDDAGGAWRDAFIRAPYLRDALVALGMVVETFETAMTWDRLDGFVDAVLRATRTAVEQACGTAHVAVRLTHAYPDGAAPYVTVIAPGRRGDEVAQWRTVKAAASEAILAAGGTITHHHAVGRDHRGWYDEQRPAPFGTALRAAKTAIDPAGILNPGVLVDP
jgi:alkyldihydroxyacetonephosphate synthase